MNSFFIAGVQRSGTTLLSVMLSKHPDIFIDKNSLGFRLVECFGNYKRVLPYNLQFTWSEIQSWLIENDYKGRLKELLNTSNLDKFSNAREVIKEGIERKLLEEGKTFFGDKSPNIQFFVNEILALIPNAKFIHVIRDGRDVALSRQKRSHRNLYLAGQEWVDGCLVGLHNEKMIGSNQYHIIRYEDLLLEPESTIKKVCRFVGVSYDPSILEEEYKSQDNDAYVKPYLDSSKIGSYKKRLSEKSIRKLEKWQGPLLERFDYSLQEKKSLGNDKLMPVLLQIWYSQGDNFKQLFRGKLVGMKGRKNVEVIVPLRSRIKKFGVKLIQDFFPDKLYRSVLKKMWVNELYYKKSKQMKRS